MSASVPRSYLCEGCSRPLAEVTLVRGDEWKIITVRLD